MHSALFFSPSAFVSLSINAKVKESITFFLNSPDKEDKKTRF